MTGSPNYSLDGKNADLFDINADGLPDVLVTQPGLFQGKDGVFFNGGSGADTFSASTISVSGVLGANADDIVLSNADVTPHDLDGDPVGQPYSYVHTQTQDGADATAGADPTATSYRDTFTYVDGLGRTLITVQQADPSAGDAAPWIASGAAVYDAKGAARYGYLPWFYNGAPTAFPVTAAPTTAYKRMRYDAFGHTIQSFNLDGSIAAQMVYHALSLDAWDAEDLAPGPHNGTPASQRHDGHGRVVSAIERIGVAGTIEQHDTRTTYLPTGEVASIARVRVGFSDAPVVRWMQYDSLGRRVLNVDPNTTAGPMPPPGSDPNTFDAWVYAYDDAGNLVGTSDARGCGVNYYYDLGGRILAEDYSPCLSAQADYSEPDSDFPSSGVETAYLYDGADPGSADLAAATPGLATDSPLLYGRLASVTDRGAQVLFQYDGRGRTTGIGKRVAQPGPANDDPTLRYAPRWYVSSVAYDEGDRPLVTSTGARAPELLNAGLSTVAVQYTQRGTVRSVGGSYGTLVTGVTRDANGLVTQVNYGDGAQTSTVSTFDARLRLSSVQTSRARAPLWSAPPAGYTPPATTPSTLQLMLENTSFTYDGVDNPVAIQDGRDPAEWPIGATPVNRTMVYDDLYRITQVNAQYAGGNGWVSPFAAENSGPVDPRLAQPSPHVSFPQRIGFQSFAYDWLGNTTSTNDDAQGFYDRSLGTITSGTAGSGPYQLQAAANAPGTPNAGALTAAYDAAGNLTSLAVQRNGPCLPVGAQCSQRFAYDWDEVGRLVQARRWDVASAGAATDPVPAAVASADLVYAYDSSNQRVIKTAADALGDLRYTVFVFGSLELRRAEWVADPGNPGSYDYDDSAGTEVPYLAAHGERLARVEYDTSDPAIGSSAVHVMLEMQDHLGSTGIVVDLATGELVERTTYQPFGATESDYRPARWDAFREDYRFTGKEEDAEVGLTYFGERFYAPLLGRWMSADPLAVHGLGADLNLYAYVHGAVFKVVDPVGLDGAADPNVPAGVEDPHSPRPGAAADPSGAVVLDTTHIVVAKQSTAALAFAGGALFGLGAGVGTAYGLGVLTGICAPCGIAAGVGILGDSLYKLATGGAESLVDSGQRILAREGTEADYFAAGSLLGGIASGRVAGGAYQVGVAHGEALASMATSPMWMLLSAGGGPGGIPPLSRGGTQKPFTPEETRLLNELFGKQVPGAVERAENFRVPQTLSRATLEAYGKLAQQLIDAKLDRLGVQARRLELVRRALEGMK